MVSFLKKFADPSPLPPQSVRVVVIGDHNVGKTALSELLVTRKPARPPKSTAGCSVSVALWEAADDAGGGSPLHVQLGDGGGGGGGGDPPKFFVEIWDVSANPYYSQLRRSLYQQVNGVILVYDASDSGSVRRLARWASEVASDGTFVAPFPEETAARNIGGLPVPVLIVANKCDRARATAGGAPDRISALEVAVSKICGAAAGATTGGAVGWLCSALRGGRRGGGGAAALSSVSSTGGGGGGSGSGRSSAAVLSELEDSVRSVRASAAAGQLDWDTVGAFFTALWARRYQPNARGGAAAFVQPGPTSSGRGGAGGGGGGVGAGGALFSSPGGGVGLFMGRRVDDDGVDEEDRRLDDWA